jgi:hypothetical protein
MPHDDGMRLMTMYMGPPATAQDEARWRAALCRLRIEGVQARLARMSSGHDPDEMVEIDDVMPLPSRKFVETWLYQKDREMRHRETRRFWLNFWVNVVLTSIAAVASVVAAMPELRTWWTSH